MKYMSPLASAAFGDRHWKLVTSTHFIEGAVHHDLLDFPRVRVRSGAAGSRPGTVMPVLRTSTVTQHICMHCSSRMLASARHGACWSDSNRLQIYGVALPLTPSARHCAPCCWHPPNLLLQIGLFAIPFVTIVGWVLGHPFSLGFDPFAGRAGLLVRNAVGSVTH